MKRSLLIVVSTLTIAVACGDSPAHDESDGGGAPDSGAQTPADAGGIHPGDDAPAGDDAGSDGATDAPSDAPPPPAFAIGMNEWVGDFAPFDLFRAASHATTSEPRICHAYTYWNIAKVDPPGGDQTHTLTGLLQWFGIAAKHCDEVLVTFQGKQSVPESAPSAAQLDAAFTAFQHLSDPGQPLEAWRGKIAYTPWNEPNNENPSGSGLTSPISPELAAAYYLTLRKRCEPTAGCKVAAGDLATNGGTANDIEWNCADDNDPANTPARCARGSGMNPNNTLPPSYLDRYKNAIATTATSQYGLPSGFRPEYFAYHPWHDVNGYIESNLPCSTYQNCVTRRLLVSLGGTWGAVEIWDDEIGVGLQTSPAPDEKTTQPCGAAFLMRLTKLSPRITQVLYMRYAAGNGPLFDGTTLRPAGAVLANRQTTYAGAQCAPMGL